MPIKSKEKILYVITKSVWGGAGKYVYDLATNLPKDKFEVFVAAGGRNELAQKLITAGIPYFEIKNFQRDINFIKEILAYFEILLLLLKIKPDIIHVNSSKAGGIVGTASLDYRFLSFNFGLRTIFTAHGWAFHESRPKWQNFLIKLFTKVTCFYYSKIICVSEYDRQSAISNSIAPKRKLITIHNGIKIESCQFLPKEKSREQLGNLVSKLETKFPSPEIWLGTIAEWTKNKGHYYLIEAIRNSKFLISNVKFILIGFDDGEKQNLELQIKNYKLENEIFLIENMPDAAKYLKAFDIFVLPSLKEGLPYTLLEAGLADLPVVTTNVGGIPEIIENEREGLLVSPANPDELAEKIEELINNPEKGKLMGLNLWHKVIQEFSLEKMLRATIAAYE